MIRAFVLPLLAAAIADIPHPAGDLTRMVETERAFAREAAVEGLRPAFRRFAAADAILFAPGPVAAGPRLTGNPPGLLRWWPLYAGIAVSGDLGFTSGPYVSGNGQPRHGFFLTLWCKQADGQWRWLLDRGIQIPEPAVQGSGAPVLRYSPGQRGGTAASAEEAEALFARYLATDARHTYGAALADGAMLMRDGRAPAVGRAAFAPLIAAGPRAVTSLRLGGGLSRAGDLAYAYGSAAWHEAGGTVHGYYIRIWQRHAHRWVLLVDQTSPAPG